MATGKQASGVEPSIREAKKIVNNHFAIRTCRPNVKVSWQVIGIRHDAYANAHRIT